jgi:two-component system, probable response regulator PhcQ
VKFSILLVDDEDEIRNALSRSLRREPYELVTASSAADALAILRQRAIDVIVSDQMMPEMTGLELFKQVRAEHPQVLRIILTGYADFDVVKSAINDAEIYRFLTKPWDDDDLRLTLRNAVHRLSLERDNHQLKQTVRRHEERLNELERLHPGITQVKRDESGAIVLDDEP